MHIKYGCWLATAIFFSIEEPGGNQFLTISCATEFTMVKWYFRGQEPSYYKSCPLHALAVTLITDV